MTFRDPFLIAALFLSQTLFGQRASFSLDGDVCKGEEVVFTNTSIDAESYLWDFCHDGLNNLASTSRVLTLNRTNIAVGTEMVYDSGIWHAFVSSLDNSKLLRLEFGRGLSAAPQEYDEYGNLGGSPGDIKFYQEAGIWYGLVGLSNSGSLLRLSFTKGLGALPLVENLGDLAGWGSVYGLSIVKDGSNVKLLVSSSTNGFYSLVDFGSSITNTPASADVLSFGSGNSLISTPIKLELLEDNGVWYGFSTSSGNNKLLRMTFENGLTSAPVINELATITGAAGLSIVKDGGLYYGFVTRGTGGNLSRLKFTNGLSASPSVESLGNLGGQLSNTWGLSLVKDQANWSAFYVGLFDRNLSKVIFEDQCEGLVLKSSQSFEPRGLSYANSGDYLIELTAIHPNGNIDRVLDTVTVLDEVAPDVIFSTRNQCVGNINTFTSINNSGDITNYRWDFGDGTILEGEANPTHQYSSAGSYMASLTVSNGNCENVYDTIVEIYNQPVAGFTKPSGITCSNNVLSFSNTTIYDFGSPVSFSWDFDGDGVEDSSLENPSFTFPNTGTYNVSLYVNLPLGCVDTVTQQLTLQEGPAVSFDWSNNCFGESIVFNNTTSDVPSYTYNWDFGDGSVFNNNRSPTHAYTEAGSYTVTLTVSEGSCESMLSQQIEVNDQPLTSLAVGPAVEDKPVSFLGNDLTLLGDRVERWLWDFDGLGTAITQEASYTFTNPGSYTITLSVNTAQGCSAQLSRLLNVAAATSPTASFSIAGDVCKGESVSLRNSSLDAENYLWDFCFESLSGLPEIAADFTPVAGISNSEGFEMVYDKGNWFGFIGDRSNGQMYLLNFGSDLSMEPSVTTVAISGDVWSAFKDIRLFNESGTWYGLVIDIGRNLYRVNFGTDIAGGTLTSENLGNLDGWQTLRGIDLKEDGVDKVAIISSWGNNKVSLIRFKGTITNVPEVLTIGEGNQLINKPFGVSLVQEGSRWFGLLSSYTNSKVLLLDFGIDSLYSEPSITEISESNNPTSSRFEKEGEKYFGYVNQENGVIIRYDFGYSVSDGIDSISVLGNLGGNLGSVYASDLIPNFPSWQMFLLNSQGKITSISFPEGDCDAVSLLSSTSASPVDLFYSSAGDYTVELTAIHPNGNIDRVIERVTVLDQSAPDIRFITSDQCVGSTNTFTSINDSGDITNYRWDFGDGTILEGETNPSYQYASAGSYTASLTVTNGSCESVYSSVVDIYNAPVASFMKPSSNICSNTPLSFTNTSTYDAGSPVSFSWDFDGDNIEDSALENPSFIYAASGTYQVSLKVALLDGCTDIFTDEIILDEGPAVSFDWSNNCFGEAVAFNNTTVDDPTYTYRWDFGDGSEINASRSPIHIYTEAENYTVSLAVNDGSCESLLSRQIEINDQPLASIATSIGVENEPIIFTGNDLTLVGDSIVSWLWDFSGLGTANTQQATYTFNSPPGIYRVTLSVTTAQGCSDEITSDVTVMASTSPSAQIGSSSPVCIGQEVEFANSSLNAESFLWDFCFESLSGLPEIIADFTPVMGISSPEGFELVYDKGNWFGFIGNRSNGQMYLLNFGSDLSMAPSVMPVVISGDVWGTYKDIRLINESGTWYGLVIDIGSNLYRVNFGTDIGGALTSENLGNLDGWQTLRGIDLKEDGADKVAIISSWGNSKVSLIRFKGTIMNAPEVLTIGEGNSLIDKPFGVSLLQEGSRWFGLLSSYTNNKVLLLDFGVDSLYSDPSVVDLGSTNQPTSSRLVREGSKYYGYTQTERNGTIRYSFGESIADGLNSVSVLGDFGLSLGSVMATSLVNVFPSWQMLLLNTEGLITSLAFPEVSCDSVSLSTSTSVSPDGLVYSSNGDYLVELTAFHANGNINRAYDTIKVAQTAVDASFITSNRCASSMNTFSVTNTSGNIISYRWDFGDGTVLEGEANPSHQYASAGSYISSLTVSNGSCENVYSSMVDIYNPPEASFTSPSANLCSNTPLKFTNTSSYDTGSPVSFSWDFNGDNVEDSAVENPSFTYNSPGTYTISLMVTLADGCMDIFSDEIILDKGPAVSFDLSNNCFGEAIVFNNTTVDDPTYTYQWNFGDGSVISTNRSPTHTYAAGSYSVNLIVSEGSCESVLSQQIEVNDQPLVSISTTRAVENQPVNFIGNDLTLAGDSIVSWMWDFGGLGTTTTQEASYTFSSPGNYTITLSVNTAQGCNTQVSSILNVNVSTLVTSFSVAGDLCKGEEVTLTNHSLNAESYLWDFCQDGLNNLAGTSQVMTLANPNIVVGTEMVYDSGHWHGFVSSLDNGKLLRLAFGADLSSTPQEYDEYGNLGGSPGDIKFYQEAGIWYGLVGLTNTGSLLRLSFNQGLNALPLVENLGDLGGWGSVYGLSIVKDGPNVKLLVSSFTNHFYSLVDFGSSITNTPTAVDILSFGSGNNLISAPIKLELLQDNSVWYGFSTSSGNNKLLRMTFENGLIAAPVINELSTITGAAGLRIVKDGGLYYGFVTRGTGGNLTRLNFNNGLAGSPTVESLGNLGGLLSGTYGFSMVKNQANWLGFYVGLVDKNLSKITFEDQCEGLALKSSQAFEPSGLSYANAGDYLIELAAIDPNGNIDRVLDTVTVLDQTAPDIRFIASDLCVGGTTFSSINESGDITNYRWDFGDGTTLEGEANPSHQYVSAGSYTVSLTVSNGNCENLYSSIVEIYNAPVARFTRPRSSVCTNTPLRFTNTSNYDAGSAVSFSWDFDGDNVEDSDLESPSFTYLSSGTYMVSLAVTLADGCTDIFTDEITLEEGLAVSFDWSNNCFGESIVFNNTTLNVPSYTYRWDFGDGSVFNTNRSPIHSYAVAGTYIVSLAVNDGSCESMFSRQIEINDQSITSFATSTAIEKELVIFTGNDLTLAADSIVSWLWDFGGLGTATTQEASYTFTSPGSYSIALSVNTAQGCSSQASRILNVATASNPTASFSVAGEVCKDESVAFTNSSLNAESYLWDFCHDGLNNLTGTSRALTLTNTNIVVGTEMVYDSGRWHGFVSSRDNSKLLRLAFGSDLSSRPQENDEYGNLGGSPGDIKFYQESGIWYALVGLTNSGSLLKLTFTKGLDALPTTENLGDLGGWGSIYGLSIVKDGSNVKLLVSSFSNRFYSLVDFGSSITNTPTVADVLSFGSGNGLISAPIKLELLKDKGIWYGFSTSSGNNKLLRLTFGSGLTSAPVIDEVATITGAAGLRVVRDGGDYYGFVTRGTGGNLTRLRFANGLAGSPTVQSLGNLGGLLSNTYGFSLVKDQTNWLGFYVGVFDENLSKIAFEDQCEGLVLQRSQAFEPSGLNYANVGDYYVELAAIHPNGNIDRIYDTVTVLDQSAPDIRFTTSDQCVGSTNTFTTINDSGDITNYRWDFGDGTILEGEANPSHQYASAGSYTARLTVSNGGCENIYSSIVNIYNASVASFDKPTSSVCTNTPLQFSNTSSYDAGSPVSFSWDFDGDNVEDSALESPSFIYTVPGTYQVSLEVTLVDGCTDIFKDEIILDDGPEVSFDWSNNCFGEEVIFNNTTLDVSSYFYTWDFGDGSVFNNNRSPAHAYAEAGSYTVTLTVSEGNCESVFFRQIEITDQPLASITTSIAVENEPIIFTGNDLTLAGDSVVSWVWDFDGLGTATTQEASYTFTNPGSYTITLNVTTAQGCIAQLSSTLNVEAASSPTASFSIAGDVCMGENVALTNSSLNAESYLWDFCFESLSGQPEITGDFTPVAGISNSEGFEMVYDKGNWFGFIGDRSNGQMYLLNFGSDPSKEPSVTPVVISGDVWGTYKDIRLINESGTWYGLVIDIGSNLYRVNFGTDIGGALTSENLGNLGGWQTLRGIDLKEDGADKVAIISSWGNNKVSLIRFKGTVTNVPEVLTIGGGNSLIDKPFGVSLLQEGSRWFGLLSSYTNNKVLLLDFGVDSLYSEPSITEISESNNPTSSRFEKEGEKYFGYVNQENGVIIRYDFGYSVSDGIDSISVLGNLGGNLGSVYASDLIPNFPSWQMFLLNSQGKITSISFPEGDCDAVSLLSSTSASPVDLFYSSAGDYTVELTAIHPNGSIDRVLDTVTVLNQTAPDISFMTTNQCVSNGSTFTAQSSTEDITNYSWDFDGDGLEDSNEASPVYTFGSVGTYDVSLTVSNGNCTNTAKQKFTIYPEPPIPSTIFTSLNNCANSEITVLNQTDTTGYGAGISYVYSFTGQPDRMTNSHQVVYQFDTPGEKILEVRAIIPGCESAIFRDTIQIIDAPVLQFSASSVCIGEVTIFTNETAGQDFFWDFGDGFTSTQKSPEHLYLTDGAYQVTLQSSNELGCTSIETIEVLVSPLPTANFDYDLVCEADGVVLTDVSTVDGSDIVAWEWYLFDELVSEEERPELVFSNSGDQTVTLRVTANNGCSSTITQDLMVLSQQEAAFDVQVACLGSASTLIDLHPNEEIISRNWFIDGQALASEQARLAYTFTEPGDYEIELSIVNQNLCASTVSKTVRVLTPPTLAFQTLNACEGEDVPIRDNTLSEEDPIVSRQWFLDNQLVGNGAQIFLSSNSAGTKSLRLDVTTAQGCSYSMTQPLVIFEGSDATFALNSNFGIPPFSLQVENNSQNAIGYEWYLNNSLFSTAENPSFSIREEGNFPLKLVTTSEEGCRDSSLVTIISARPMMDLSVSFLSLEQESILLELTNNGNLPITYVDYTISLADEFLVEQRYNQRVNIDETVLLKIDLVFPRSPNFICVNVQSPYDTQDLNPDDNEVCINLNQKAALEAPYPNPARDYSRVHFVIPEVDEIMLTLIDLSGQVRYTKAVADPVAGLNLFELDLRSLEAGTYFFLIEYQGNTYESRIIKQ